MSHIVTDWDVDRGRVGLESVRLGMVETVLSPPFAILGVLDVIAD